MNETGLGARRRAGIHDEPGAAHWLVGAAWLFLTINVLGYVPLDGMIILLPGAIGQLITMGSLVAAFGLALLLNPRVRILPNAFLLLLLAMAVLAIARGMTLQSGLGSLLRAFRLTVFVATLWLLSQWWRGDMRFARFHLRTLGAVLFTVLLGIIVVPGSAFAGPGGRLMGAIWPIPSTQVGQYCAVATGLAVIMWLTRHLDGRSAGLVVVPAVAMLLLSHTRTALVSLVAALGIAVLTLAWTSSRARRAIAVAVAFGSVVAVAFGQFAVRWFRRGQDAEALANLTGRQKVWNLLLAEERTVTEQLLGVGLTDKSFAGLPIDSGWLAAYHELGWVGIVIIVAFLCVLVGTAALRPPSPARACAVFLIFYCIIAAYTEVGLGDASAYLLHLAVAASLLARSVTEPTAGTKSGGST